MLKSNLIRSIEFGTAVARRLKRALNTRRWLLFVYLFVCLFVCFFKLFIPTVFQSVSLLFLSHLSSDLLFPYGPSLHRTPISDSTFTCTYPVVMMSVGGHGPCNRFPLFDFVFRSITSLCTLGARVFFFANSWALSNSAHGYFIVVSDGRMIKKRPAGNAGEKEGWRPSRSGQEARLRSGTIRKDLPVGRTHTQISRRDLWSQGYLYADPCLRRTLCVNCSVLFLSLSLSLIHMNLLIPYDKRLRSWKRIAAVSKRRVRMKLHYLRIFIC